MSTSTTPLSQYLFVIPDHVDAEALNRRLQARPSHVERATSEKEKGHVHLVGAILDEKNGDAMSGSVVVINAATREEAAKMLDDDPYVKGKVWDMTKKQVFKIRTLK